MSDGITFTIGTWSTGMPTPVQDSLGCLWWLTDYKGWAGSPAPRTNVIDREQSDGEFDGPAWQPGRQITLDGKVTCPSNFVMHETMDVFNALLVAGSRTATMTVTEPHVTRQTVIRRDAENDFTPVGNTDAEFSLILYAADPARYGSTLQTASAGVATAAGGRAYNWAPPRAYGAFGTAGSVVITNNGNLTTYPIITITAGAGPMVNPTISIPGGLSLAFTLNLNAGDSLVIDTGQRTAILNGTAPRAWPLNNGTLGCPGGSTQYLFTANTADPTAAMTVTWRDAYA